MIYSVPDMKRIDHVPHRAQYSGWNASLSQRLGPLGWTFVKIAMGLAKFPSAPHSSCVPGRSGRFRTARPCR